MKSEKEPSIVTDRGDTMAVVACFVIDTIDLLDRGTRSTIADLLERRLSKDYTNVIMTDPSKRLHRADAEQVISGITEVVSALRGKDPYRDEIRRSMGLDNSK